MLDVVIILESVETFQAALVATKRRCFSEGGRPSPGTFVATKTCIFSQTMTFSFF